MLQEGFYILLKERRYGVEMKRTTTLINITISALILSIGLNVYFLTKRTSEPKVLVIVRTEIVEKIIALETYQRGIASFYSTPEHGRITASGVRYDMNGLSCAHHDLPFGTILIVTNMKNNKSVRLVVNDRMPELYRKRNRIIDLSLGAGKVIDMINDGVVNVKIQIVREQ